MVDIERDAFNIVKGEMNGDEFLWDAIWYEKDGRPMTGGWKSTIEKKGSSGA